jgi:hypothetical protein
VGGSGGTSKMGMLVVLWTVKIVFLRLQIGMRTLLVIELESVHTVFWKRTCLHFVLTLRLCGRLSLK